MESPLLGGHARRRGLLDAVRGFQPTVPLALWPLPFEIDLPAYLLVSAALLAGFAVGAIVAWIGGYRLRRELGRRNRRIAALERQLAATQSRLENDDKSTKSALSARG
jgi:hypothetical protein